MHILLLGSKGQVGQEIEKLAITQNIKIFGFDIDGLDITNIAKLDHAFKQNGNIDVVINAVAYTNVDKAEDEPEKAYQTNCQGAQNLANVCQQYDIPLLHLSTDYIFSGEKITPYTETDTAEPLGVYGKSKLAGDQAIEKTWQKHIILRVSWVFSEYGNNFVKKILRLAQEHDTLNIVDDQSGCPTAASDAARVLLIIAEKIFLGQKVWGTYNYCNYPAITWHGFATKIVDLGRNKFKLKTTAINKITSASFQAKAKRPKNSELLVMKITKDYAISRKDWESYLVEAISNINI
jgi:dTDP-4-dehydrorhamnose reductase